MSLEDRVREIVARAKASRSTEVGDLLAELQSAIAPEAADKNRDETAEYHASVETSGPATYSVDRRVGSACAAYREQCDKGNVPPIEVYLDSQPAAIRSVLLPELIRLEVEFRRRKGENPTAAEFGTRFPGDAASISEALPTSPPEADATQAFEPTPADESRFGMAPKEPAGTFGDYELLNEIAHGGMGVVYRARQVSLDRTVALKLIRSGHLASEAEVERFYVEARAAAKLKHVGILPIYEVGEHRKQHFFAMELVEGGSLQGRLNDNVLPPAEAVEIVRNIAEAVQHAHDNEVVHRDLKPDNILLDSGGQPKVADFGLAKQIDEDAGQTIDGTVIGTPSYMPPEQAAGETDRVGKRSDIYSLGAVLYCTLTGRPPFRAASPLETIKQVLDQEPTPPRAFDKSIPKDLETICLKCLRKDLNQRYATAGDLAADLTRWLKNEPIQARPVSRLERSWLWCRRRPVVAGLVALLVLIVVAGSWIFVERQTALYARTLVDSLVKADTREVTGLIDEVEQYKRWTRRLLEDRLRAAQHPVEQRHLRLALLRFDASHIDPLLDDLLSCRNDELGLVRKELLPHKATIAARLWTALRQGDPARRFRAGLTLAQHAPDDSQWTDADASFMVDRLVGHASEEQPRLRGYLAGIKTRLYSDLQRVLRAGAGKERREVGSAKALAEFAADDPATIAEAIANATPAQYEVLYPVVASQAAEAEGQLARIMSQKPADTFSIPERVAFGRRRAGAAISLLRRGGRENVLDALRITRDPESLTQFVHGCRGRGVTPSELLECLERADALRQMKKGRQRRLDDVAVFGLLLALGEFTLADLPVARRSKFVDQLENWYASDPSSAIHGAAGWLLRHWGFTSKARNVDRTPLPYSSDREWFVRQVNKPHRFRDMTLEKLAKLQEQFKDSPSAVADLKRIEKAIKKNGGRIWMNANGLIRPTEPPSSFFFTFIVFPAGEYSIGAAADEPDRRDGETPARVRLSAPFAVLDREVSRGEFEAFDGRKLPIDTFSPSDDHPIVASSWYGSVAFCRSLTANAGIAEDQQCYPAPGALSLADLPREPSRLYTKYPRNWPIDLKKSGFRLLTEAEWEIMCRAGTDSLYHFGGDVTLLNSYAFFAGKSGPKARPSRSRRPNLRGIFDAQGNVGEWCHDWNPPTRGAQLADPIGSASGSTRVIRGGSWDRDPIECRSAARVHGAPTASAGYTGFRIAVSLPSR